MLSTMIIWGLYTQLLFCRRVYKKGISTTVYPKAAKRFPPCAIWIHIATLHSLNFSAIIAAVGELLTCNYKKKKLWNHREFWPLAGAICLGHDTKWSAVFEWDKHSKQPRANLISFRINSPIVSDAPLRLAQFVSANQISVGRLVQLLIRTMLWISCTVWFW